MAWIFSCADQHIHRSKRNKSLPPCFQLMYVGPGTGKPHHFYGFGKEGDPIPASNEQDICFRWGKRGSKPWYQSSLHSFIKNSWSTYTAHVMANSLTWQALRAETADRSGADWDCGFSESTRAFCEGAIAWKVEFNVLLQNSVVIVTKNRWSPCSSWHKHKICDMCESPSTIDS